MSGRKFHSGLADGVIFEYKAFKRLPLGLYLVELQSFGRMFMFVIQSHIWGIMGFGNIKCLG